jgi:ATP-dependent Clp protease adaptor protein ClpS
MTRLGGPCHDGVQRRQPPEHAILESQVRGERCRFGARLDRRPESGHIAHSGMPEPPTPTDPPNEEDLQVVERARTKRPRRYQVVLHNDDYTTMEFVVEVLMRFFRKDITQARHIMLHVHHKGYGIVDTFPRDVAETKAEQVMDFAREHGHPLRCTAEPESGEGPEDE